MSEPIFWKMNETCYINLQNIATLFYHPFDKSHPWKLKLFVQPLVHMKIIQEYVKK